MPARAGPRRLANPKATFDTSAGAFTAEIYADQMPLTAGNFVDLALRGFFDGLHFHRVVQGFMCQLGCPISADPKADAGEGAPEPGSSFTYVSAGGEGVVVTRGTEGDGAGCIEDEHTCRLENVAGTLAMANNDSPHTGGSQFFINVADNAMLNWWNEAEAPESKHPVFGKLVDEASMDVVLAISRAAVDDDEKPVKPIKVKNVTLA